MPLQLKENIQLTLAESSNSATATILDNDAPELSIVAGADIEEADEVDAEFKVIANFMPSTGLLVRYIPTSENFLATVEESGEVTQVSSALNFQNVNDQFIATLPVRVNNDDSC